MPWRPLVLKVSAFLKAAAPQVESLITALHRSLGDAVPGGDSGLEDTLGRIWSGKWPGTSGKWN